MHTQGRAASDCSGTEMRGLILNASSDETVAGIEQRVPWLRPAARGQRSHPRLCDGPQPEGARAPVYTGILRLFIRSEGVL